MLRLAVPPRHATAEKAVSEPAPTPRSTPDGGLPRWAEVTSTADAFLRHLAAGESPRAVWSAAPADDWPRLLAEAVATAYAAGRGALVCVPDARDVARVDAALDARLGPGHHVCLTADAGPSARYRDFLAVSRGARRVVVGTRAAAFAPVHDLGLVVVWDDGDDLHAEPRAPYPHTRDVLLIRAAQQATAVLLAGVARTAEVQQLVASGWVHELSVPRPELRRRVRVEAVPGEDRSIGTPGPARRLRRAPRRSGVGSGAGADPAGRLRRVAGVRQLPHAGALHGVHGTADDPRAGGAAAVPVVRPRRVRVGVPDLPRPGAAGPGAR